MTLHNTNQRRGRRLARLFTVAFTLFLVWNLAVPTLLAQESTPEAPAATETVAPPAESPTGEATTPPSAAEESAPEEVVTFAVDTTPEAATPTETPVEPAIVETAVPEPTGATGEPSAELAADGPNRANVRVITVSGSESGPRIPHVCVTIVGPLYGIPEAFGCTDANGEVTLDTASSFSGSKLFIFRVSIPSGYTGISDPAYRLAAGSLTDVVLVFTPLPLVTETLRTLDAVSGTPVGGACWSYYETSGDNVLGNLAIGPVCDDDQDGTVTVTDIPHRAFCVVLTPPNGHTVLGANQVCTNITQRPTNITKALSASNLSGNGSATVTVKATWGEPLANICVQASLLVGGDAFSVNSACTNGAGQATITGLIDGDYTVAALSWPFGWDTFTTGAFTITSGNSATIELTATRATYQRVTFTTLYAAGPDKVGGSCWSISTGVPGLPGNYEIVSGICDTDGDGVAVYDPMPYGTFCFTLTPPAGYYRTDRTYTHCNPEPTTGTLDLTIGVVQIPVTPVATVVQTPTPSPTPMPTPTPVPSEPIGSIRVVNCADAHRVFSSGEPNYELCQAAPAGVRFAVIQNGVQITTVTTGANGTIALELADRAPYQLQYLDGNVTPYIPAPGQNALNRYDSRQQFFFIRDPQSDHTWTFTLRLQGNNDGFTVITPLGGACARVVGEDNAVYLPELCDTDNDGEITIGQLAPRYNALQSPYYRIELTRPPTGYPAKTPSGGLFDPNRPNEYLATLSWDTNTLRVHIVDGDNNPVLGYCLTGDANIYGGSFRCDGNTYYGSEGTAADGVIEWAGLVPGVPHAFSTVRFTAGWTPDTNAVTFSTTTAPITDVYYRVHPSGTSNANQADVRVQIDFAPPPAGWTATTRADIVLVCYRIAGGVGNPAGGVCASPSGGLLFHNVPQGSYSLILNAAAPACAKAPASVLFTVGPGDLGGTVHVPIMITGCSYENLVTCSVQRVAPAVGRTVDLYYGRLTGPNGGTRLDTLQMSESIPSILRESMLGTNPDPAHITSAALAFWTEPYYYDSGGIDWSRRPDWDGNAYQRMVDAYGAVSNDYNLAARIDHGSYKFVSGVGLIFDFVDGSTDMSLYPECPPNTGDLYITFNYETTVNIYELNAAEPAPPEPEITPIPSPEALCETTVTRGLDLYYGSVTGQSQATRGMALSAYIPLALRTAIANGSGPSQVRNGIGAWVGSGLENETWAENAPDPLDAAANLRAQLTSGGATAGNPIDEGVTEYRFVTYRYLDATQAPGGCRGVLLAAEEDRPTISVLIPVLQTTIVPVHYYQLNAAFGGGSPSPTPTETSTPPAGQTPTATPPVGSTPTATPGTGITGLPNTGAGPSPRSDVWLVELALLLVALVVTAGLLRRRRI